MSRFTIRDAELPRERAALCAFIMGSQHFEHAIEPNRRLDPPVAEEHLAKLETWLAKSGGRMLVAQDAAGIAIGWGVVGENQDEVFIVEAERRHAYIAELFVDEAWRGAGVGRALIAACEAWARACGIGVMQIGVLAGNARAHGIYRRAGYGDYAYQLRKYLR